MEQSEVKNGLNFSDHFKKMLNKTKRSILIIENDENILKNLFQRFQRVGLFPITAKDGYEGYMRACNEKPDFIISESLLPLISGFRLSRLLKYDERYKNIPLVLLSDNDFEISSSIFSSCGADKILKKPFKFSQLLESIGLTTA